MARRAELDANESLDLFLDAISNVFGAVLFVALIVVLLLQLTQRAAPPAPPASTEYAEAALTLERLEMPADRSAEEAALRELLAARMTAQARVDELERRLDETERRRDERDQTLRDLREQLEAARAELQSARDALATAQAQHAGVIRLPQFRSTTKSEIPLLVAGGRVAPLFEYDERGLPVAVNSAGVEVTGDGRRVRIKPGGGAAVTPDNAAEIVRILTRHTSPDRHYIALGVWQDSFEQGALLRDALVATGYEYGLVPLPKDATIPLGAQSGVQ